MFAKNPWDAGFALFVEGQKYQGFRIFSAWLGLSVCSLGYLYIVLPFISKKLTYFKIHSFSDYYSILRIYLVSGLSVLINKTKQNTHAAQMLFLSTFCECVSFLGEKRNHLNALNAQNRKRNSG